MKSPDNSPNTGTYRGESVQIVETDYAIVTTMEEAYLAVLDQLDRYNLTTNQDRVYARGYITAEDNQSRSVTVVRCTAQGDRKRCGVTRDFVQHIKPRFVFTCGIARGRPSTDCFLGDVVLGDSTHDLTALAEQPHGSMQPSTVSESWEQTMANMLSVLPAVQWLRSGVWGSPEALRVPRPAPSQNARLYGSDGLRKRAREAEAAAHERDEPRFMSGPIGFTDSVIPNTEQLSTVMRAPYGLLAVAMKSAGVYHTLMEENVGFISVLGINEVVGVERNDAWTRYACATASSFLVALLRSGVAEKLSSSREIDNNRNSLENEDVISTSGPRAPLTGSPITGRVSNPSERSMSAGPNKVCIDALVMKGGGVKGLALASAVRELEKYYDFATFVGTSAGAIAAVLLASGYSGRDVEEELRRKDFSTFLDSKPFTYLINYFRKNGIHSGFPIQNWLAEMVHDKVPRAKDVTLADLPKRAVVYATSRNDGEVTFDGRGERHSTSASFAVRCSMSIPYFFWPQTVDGRASYDGGMLHNFPLQIFLDQEGNKHQHAPPTFIALYLGSDRPQPFGQHIPLGDLLTILFDRNDRRIIDKFRDRTIVIDPSPIRTIDFSLTEAEKRLLISQGRAAALGFLLNQNDVPATHKKSIKTAHQRALTEASELKQTVTTARRKRSKKRGALIAMIVILFTALVTIWRIMI
jgi:predicted acylesterase/phospholipase RssA/nucleoside phosphorylase